MGGCLLIIVFLFHWLLVNANNNGTIIEDSSNQDNPYMTKSAGKILALFGDSIDVGIFL